MDNKILIETSARHVHLSPEHVEVLFGKGAQLEPRRELTQPGIFVCKERVDVVGPKRTLSGVSILGPCRGYTQVEVSLTDARSLGIAAPIRESGDLKGSPGCKIIGPAGELEISEGVITALRHVHMKTSVAEELGVVDKEIVCVKVSEGERKLIFDDVLVRVHPKVDTFMHIDTDEANAAGISGPVHGELLKKQK